MQFGGVTQEMMIVSAAAFVAGILVSYLIIRRPLKHRYQLELRQSKDQFISLASHYLLTPISIIQGALAPLQENDSALTVEERQKHYLNIQKGERRLWILAEQLLLVSQIEEGMLKIKLEASNIADAAESAIAAVDVFAREKKLQLVFENATQALQQGRFDVRRVKQAIVAVLDNAVKFSPENGIIRVVLRQDDSVFVIQVIDQGAGMSTEALRTATQTFARGTSSYTYDHEGIGLGLYTANAIVREHGGELLFDSKPKQGTTVTLKFPNQ
ncbi:MAG TPA: HAMP domain-containing sensor histidine kinase [Verrucomicrobiae bacterium]|nr:HAMP domain-containing sensor histidine kinase [Verrucomicrobiae bacterium]